MNIQIFGKTKCFDSKSAERFFKERKVKYQYIDILDKGISPKELDKFLLKIKDIDSIVDTKSHRYEESNFKMLRSVDMKKKVLLDNPELILTPLVRDCESGNCTVGKAENIWKTWK